MIKKIKYIAIGFIVGSMLMFSLTIYATTAETIQVIPNLVKIEVDGEIIEVDNFLFKGITYAPLRVIAEMVGRNVEWNEKTSTAIIAGNKTKGDEVAIDEYKIAKGYLVGDDICVINNEEYYIGMYMLKLLNEHSWYGANFPEESNHKFSIYREDGSVLIDDVSYIMIRNRLYVSKDYYENTILPLVEK